MMKLSIQIILALTFASVATTAASAQQDGVKKLNEEDGQFWDRLLEGNGSLSVPTNPPTSPPTPSPTNSPTNPPTQSPTNPPTQSPTNPPTQSPTNPPTRSPTNPPTGVCVIQLDAECVIAGSSSQAGIPCDLYTPSDLTCSQRPTSAVMLFNGGGCEQSDNRQPFLSTCEDSNGGPPVREGDMVYIRVTGDDIPYFSGLVAVGDSYPINYMNTEFTSAPMVIRISDPATDKILQIVKFRASCSRPLTLGDRFGASELVEFVNEEQGVVSFFVSLLFSIEISIPITATNQGPVSLQTLTVSTNFAGDQDLSDQVIGREIPPPVVVTLEGTIDVSKEMRYMATFYVTGILESTGQLCEDSDMLSFYIKPPERPSFPSPPPTKRPVPVPTPFPSPGPSPGPTPGPTPSPSSSPSSPPTYSPTKAPKAKKAKKAKSMKGTPPPMKKAKGMKGKG